MTQPDIHAFDVHASTNTQHDLTLPTNDPSILKVVGSHSDIELRNTCLARNNLDFVAATVMPASSAISFIEASDR